MRRRFPPLAAVAVLVLAAASAALAQGSARPVYNDKDKQKLAEISKRPEVVEQIDAAWQNVRRQDMEFAFRVNTAATLGDWRNDPQWLDVWSKYGRLYDNPILVNYVNSLGQRLVPQNSPNLYAFRLLLDPTPRAEALSTGTIYVTTGLVSLLDNEAQLAYVLAHEIAHVERSHMQEAIRNEILETELDKEREKSSQRKRALFGAAMAVAGGVAGNQLGGASGAITGALAGFAGGQVGGAFLFRNKFEPTQWDSVHENEADEAGLNAMLNQQFDVREAPRVYVRVAGLVQKDKRLGLGFIGDSARVRERTAYVESQIGGSLKPKIDQALTKGGLVGSSPEFAVLMAALKRDNGIVALDYDFLPMAKDNLEEAAKLRSNDPRAHYYLGKLYAQTGRSAEEKQLAVTHLQNAIRYDAERGSFPDPHLEYALSLIAQNNPASQPEIRESLKRYVGLYQRQHRGEVPQNMHIIYDYLLMAGESAWYAPPVSVIAPRDNQPLPVSTGAAAEPAPAPAATPAARPAARPAAK